MARPKIPRKKRRGQRDLSSPFTEHLYVVGEPEHGMRLDAFIAARVKWRSREGSRHFFADQMVNVLPGSDPQQAQVGGIRRGLKLRAGQEVVLRTPAPKPPPNAPDPKVEAEGLECVFEDEWLVAVNKPPGISVHPSKGHLTGSLIHLVHERHRRLYPDSDQMPTLCHRLDRETSGVMLCAKDQLSRTRIGRQFEARTVKKTYLALVEGNLADDSGVIDLPIGKALESAVMLRMGIRPDDQGLPSLTEWEVRERVSTVEQSNKTGNSSHGLRTLVELRPKTGRTHQLRVHLEAIGHPIVGDKIYLGGDDVFIKHVSEGLTADDLAALGLERQALHAWKLELEHPMTGKRVELEAPLYSDIRNLL